MRLRILAGTIEVMGVLLRASHQGYVMSICLIKVCHGDLDHLINGVSGFSRIFLVTIAASRVGDTLR